MRPELAVPAEYKQTIEDSISEEYWNAINDLENAPFPDLEFLHAVAILGAPLEPTLTSETDSEHWVRWNSPVAMEEHPGKGLIQTAGGWRAKAASILSNASNHQTLFLVTGGVHRYKLAEKEFVASKATHMKNHMIALGVPPHMIIEIGTEFQGNTLGNFTDMKHYLEQLEDMGIDIRSLNIGFLTSLYQQPRTIAMIKQFKQLGRPDLNWLREDGRQLIPISAEPIVLSEKDEYSEEVHASFGSPAHLKRIAMEMQGMQDMKNGYYAVRSR